MIKRTIAVMLTALSAVFLLAANPGTKPTYDDLYLNSSPSTKTAIRHKLNADVTYYVRTDGSDSNTCLANTSGAACLTIGGAYGKFVNSVDGAGHVITIKLADGAYTGGLCAYKRIPGDPQIIIEGNTTTPSNVTVTNEEAGSGCDGTFYFERGHFGLKGLTIVGGTALDGIHASFISRVSLLGALRFGTAVVGQIDIDGGAYVYNGDDYEIVGNAAYHVGSQTDGVFQNGGGTITLTGTPAYSYAFAYSYNNGLLQYIDATFSGSATGNRFRLETGGAINTSTNTATYFPGNAAGLNDGSGVYDTTGLNFVTTDTPVGADIVLFQDVSGSDINAVTLTNLAASVAFTGAYQPLDSDLTSWALITRASGFDTFATTPTMANLGTLLTNEASGWITFGTTASSANFASLVTDETGTDKVVFNTSPGFTTAINPLTDDAAALGTTALGWADLFLATGGTIHFANTDWVATHSTGILTIGTGTLKIATPTNNTTSVLTTDATQTITNKSIVATQITAGTLNIGNNTFTTGTIEMANGTANTISCSSGDCTIEGNGFYRAGGTDVAVADGGTGVSALGTGAVTFLVTPSMANLGTLLTDDASGWITFGTTPSSANLASLVTDDVFSLSNATLGALSTYNTNGLLTQTAANTFTGRTVTGTANEITLTNGNGVSGNPTITLATLPKAGADVAAHALLGGL